mmetsp:Transcript_59439/g.173960  ORF Transcript_59439/g.173960 Transcript_59439/m.173960 type:complete len:249 (+) Transcript_59439:259-1005(+)
MLDGPTVSPFSQASPTLEQEDMLAPCSTCMNTPYVSSKSWMTHTAPSPPSSPHFRWAKATARSGPRKWTKVSARNASALCHSRLPEGGFQLKVASSRTNCDPEARSCSTIAVRYCGAYMLSSSKCAMISPLASCISWFLLCPSVRGYLRMWTYSTRGSSAGDKEDGGPSPVQQGAAPEAREEKNREGAPPVSSTMSSLSGHSCVQKFRYRSSWKCCRDSQVGHTTETRPFTAQGLTARAVGHLDQSPV